MIFYVMNFFGCYYLLAALIQFPIGPLVGLHLYSVLGFTPQAHWFLTVFISMVAFAIAYLISTFHEINQKLSQNPEKGSWRFYDSSYMPWYCSVISDRISEFWIIDIFSNVKAAWTTTREWSFFCFSCSWHLVGSCLSSQQLQWLEARLVFSCLLYVSSFSLSRFNSTSNTNWSRTCKN